MPQFRFVFPAVALTFLFLGCEARTISMETTEQRRMLELLMPSRIEIIEPFTSVRSFKGNSENKPDGIELLLQARNALDNPGLMIAGKVRAELFEYVQASADSKGQRLDHWEIELSQREHQQKYWDQVTQMYQFKLGIDPNSIPPSKRYVLAVTYTSPLGVRLVDECLIRHRPTVVMRSRR